MLIPIVGGDILAPILFLQNINENRQFKIHCILKGSMGFQIKLPIQITRHGFRSGGKGHIALFGRLIEQVILQNKFPIFLSVADITYSRLPQAETIIEHIKVDISIATFAHIECQIIGGKRRVILARNLFQPAINRIHGCNHTGARIYHFIISGHATIHGFTRPDTRSGFVIKQILSAEILAHHNPTLGEYLTVTVANNRAEINHMVINGGFSVNDKEKLLFGHFSGLGRKGYKRRGY